jgi:riboflavin synthase
MFTGLVQAVGTVVSTDRQPDGLLRLGVDAGTWQHTPSPGDSIAVDGCCLTLVGPPQGGVLRFDVVPQTLAATTLASVRPGQRVNLEHAATMATFLGGHIVQGHVDGVGVVEQVKQASGDWRVTVRIPEHAAIYMVEKGSICVSGVSLTLAEVGNEGRLITVALIPTTLALTNLGELASGTGVNIEADAMTKAVVTTVKRLMESRR